MRAQKSLPPTKQEEEGEAEHVGELGGVRELEGVVEGVAECVPNVDDAV